MSSVTPTSDSRGSLPSTYPISSAPIPETTGTGTTTAAGPQGLWSFWPVQRCSWPCAVQFLLQCVCRPHHITCSMQCEHAIQYAVIIHAHRNQAPERPSQHSPHSSASAQHLQQVLARGMQEIGAAHGHRRHTGHRYPAQTGLCRGVCGLDVTSLGLVPRADTPG
jgi:hypothetical protein